MTGWLRISFWAWLASILALVIVGLLIGGEVGDMLRSIGILDCVLFICAVFWRAMRSGSYV
jgi:hypothetical protein